MNPLICPVCGGQTLETAATQTRDSYLRCAACGHVFLAQPQAAAPFFDKRRLRGALSCAISRSRGEDTALFVGAESARVMLSELGDKTESGRDNKRYSRCYIAGALSAAADPVALLMSLRDRLKPNAFVAVADIVLDDKKKRFHLKSGSLYNQLFTGNSLENLLVKCGYQNVYRLRRCSRDGDMGVTLCRMGELPKTKQTLSLIIPVYNEAATVREVLELLVKKDFGGLDKELLIVESNSTDGTREIVREFERYPCVRAIYEERPQGKGHGVRTGLAACTGDIIAIQDGDLEYDIEDYDKLLAPIIDRERAFVLGSRHSGSINMRSFEHQKLTSAVMNLGHVIFTSMINISCGARLRDPFTMFKLFRKECLFGVELVSNRFDLDWEIATKFLKKGYNALEIPIKYISRPYSEGKKVNFVLDPLLWIKAWVRFGWRRGGTEKRLIDAEYPVI